MSDLPQINHDFFQAHALTDRDDVVVTLSGTGDMRVVPELENLMPALHSKATELGCERVTIDLRACEFMNSSCFRSFVNWLNWIRELPDDQRYKVKFLTDPKRHWQQPSLSALSRFAVDIVEIEG